MTTRTPTRPQLFRCVECGKPFPSYKIFHLRRLKDRVALTMCIHCLLDYLMAKEATTSPIFDRRQPG